MKQLLHLFKLLAFTIYCSSTGIFAQLIDIEGPEFICNGDTALYYIERSTNPDIADYIWIFVSPYFTIIEQTDTSALIVSDSTQFAAIAVQAVDTGMIPLEYGLIELDIGGVPGISFDIAYFPSNDSVLLSHNSTVHDSIRWNMGDGSPDQTGDSIYHQFTHNTIHEVCATVYSPCGEEVYCDSVCLDPNSDFHTEIASGKDSVLFLYTGSPGDSVVWEFGDGSASMQGDTVLHVYDDHNFFEVCATVYSVCGVDQYCDTIDVCSPPQTTFLIEVDQHAQSVDIIYEGGHVDSIKWDINSGELTSMDDSIRYTYSLSDADILICVTAYSACGESHYCDTFSICDYLIASFSYEVIDSATNTVLFTAEWPDGSLVLWDLGEETYSSGDSVIKTYSTNDIFEVCARFYSACETITICDTIDLCVDPNAHFNYTLIPESDSILFTYTGSPSDSVVWDFGDGSQLHENDSTYYIYQLNEQYEVCVTTYDNCGEVTFCDSVDNRRIGLESISNSTIVVYPNPSSNSFIIEGLQSEHSYFLSNSNGQVISNGTLSPAENRLELTTHPSGIYFLKIMQDNQYKIVKLIKL